LRLQFTFDTGSKRRDPNQYGLWLAAVAGCFMAMSVKIELLSSQSDAHTGCFKLA
jgi:hypothetical protein